MRCYRCNTENPGHNTYCDNCGSMLHDIAPNDQASAGFAPDARTASPLQVSYEYSSQLPDNAYSPQLLERQKILNESMLSRLIRIVLYIIGIFIAAIGLFGTFTTFGTSDRVTSIALFFMFALITASVVIFIRTRKRMRKLRWPTRFWWIGGDIAGFFMAAALVFAVGKLTDPLPNYLFGITVLAFGLVLAGAAYW